jgi:hypothetical protein
MRTCVHMGTCIHACCMLHIFQCHALPVFPRIPIPDIAKEWCGPQGKCWSYGTSHAEDRCGASKHGG